MAASGLLLLPVFLFYLLSFASSAPPPPPPPPFPPFALFLPDSTTNLTLTTSSDPLLASPLPPSETRYTIPLSSPATTLRFYSPSAPPENLPKAPIYAKVCLSAARHEYLLQAPRLHRAIDKELDYRYKGVELAVFPTGRKLTWRMLGATVKGLQWWVQEFGGAGCLFDVEVQGERVRVGTGRMGAIGGESGGDSGGEEVETTELASAE